MMRRRCGRMEECEFEDFEDAIMRFFPDVIEDDSGLVFEVKGTPAEVAERILERLENPRGELKDCYLISYGRKRGNNYEVITAEYDCDACRTSIEFVIVSADKTYVLIF